MHDKHGRFRGKSRAALVWTLSFFLGGQLILGLFVYCLHPEMCDPEFQFRLRELRARLAEAPGRPLALVVGSSRVAFGFQPAIATKQGTLHDREAVLYNFAMLGGGPVRERMVLHRLLKSGVKPKWLFVEMWAPFLPQLGFYDEENVIFKHDMYWPDVPVIERLYSRRWVALSTLFEETLTPAVHCRERLLDLHARFLLPYASAGEIDFGKLSWVNLDGLGWLSSPFGRPDPATFANQMEHARGTTQSLLTNFCISDISDRALHDLLEECRAQDIQVALLLMPEHSTLRSWYPASTHAVLTTYLQRLRDTYQTPVIDARTWCSDEDFADYCHLDVRGARSFSEHFGREVYRPILQGQALAKDLLLRDIPTP